MKTEYLILLEADDQNRWEATVFRATGEKGNLTMTAGNFSSARTVLQEIAEELDNQTDPKVKRPWPGPNA